MKISKEALTKELQRRIYLSQKKFFHLEKFLFDKQLDFVRDPSPYKIALCSRRAGKTVSCAAHLIDSALKNSGTTALYITTTANNARKIVWPVLLQILRDNKIPSDCNDTHLRIRFQNNSTIYLGGAKDKEEGNKFRGLNDLQLVYIDESQSFRPTLLESLIDDVIAPGLMDRAGHLSLLGTPGPIPTGYFHDVYTGSHSWSKHFWTYWDNPFIALKSKMSHQELLDRELKRKGVEISDPTIQREWFGRWVIDANSLLLNYSPSLNHYVALPQEQWIYLMGIDLGFIDSDAIAVIAWSEKKRETYLVHERVIAKQDITSLVESIRDVSTLFPITKMVIDEGGLGKKIAEEIRRRHGIPLIQAEKTRKMENYALLNDALKRGHFKAKQTSRFAQDSSLLEVDRDKSTPDKIKVKDTYHSDIVDAVLYAFRESPAFSYQAPLEKPKLYSPEWADAETERMEEEAEEYFKAQEDASKGFQADHF